MKPREDLDLLREALLARPPAGSPTTACLNEETIAGFAEGTLDSASRAAAMAHLAECARCRGAVASVARALAAEPVSREVAVVGGSRWRRVARVAVPLAAAAVLLLLALPRQLRERQAVHRAPTFTAAAAPAALAPLGTVAEPDALVWSAVAGADRYRVTLFDAGSRVVYETELADTVAVLPDSTRLAPGQPYLWKVEARTGRDRWSASPLVQFIIAGSVPR